MSIQECKASNETHRGESVVAPGKRFDFKFPDIPSTKLEVLATKLSFAEIVQLFKRPCDSDSECVSCQILHYLDENDLREIPRDDLIVILDKPIAKLAGSVTPEYQMWKRLVDKYHLVIGRVTRGKSRRDRYLEGPGAHRGKQRIGELEDMLREARQEIVDLMVRIDQMLSYSEDTE